MIRLTTSTKLLGAGIALSLGWIVLAACECDQTNKDNFPGFWVTCIGNKPTLMTYSGDNPSVVTSDPAGDFSPSQWDCSTPGSPPQPKSNAPLFIVGSPSGPNGFARRHAAGSTQSTYLPQQIRALPFTPYVPPPGAPPVCDSTYPDIFQTVHTQAVVTRINTCPFKIVASIPVVTRPLQVQITPDGSTALVTSFDNAVNFIDLSTNKVTFTLMTDQSINPDGLAITSDGSRAYVTSFDPDNPVVLVIDLASRTVIATISSLNMSYPQGATLTPDGSQLWVTSPIDSETDVVDTLTNTLAYRLNIGATTDVAFNSTGTRAYVTSASTSPARCS
jgi:DNA-binding beta-propeller fold protein YncE